MARYALRFGVARERWTGEFVLAPQALVVYCQRTNDYIAQVDAKLKNEEGKDSL